MKFAKLFFTVALLGISAQADAQTRPSNSASFGIWKVQGADGLKGELVLSNGLCQLSVTTAMSSVQALCISNWDGISGLLNVYTYGEGTRSFSVPAYGRERAAVPTVSFDPNPQRTSPSIGFVIERIRRNTMTGHITGFGGLERVTFTRH